MREVWRFFFLSIRDPSSAFLDLLFSGDLVLKQRIDFEKSFIWIIPGPNGIFSSCPLGYSSDTFDIWGDWPFFFASCWRIEINIYHYTSCRRHPIRRMSIVSCLLLEKVSWRRIVIRVWFETRATESLKVLERQRHLYSRLTLVISHVLQSIIKQTCMLVVIQAESSSRDSCVQNSQVISVILSLQQNKENDQSTFF